MAPRASTRPARRGPANSQNSGPEQNAPATRQLNREQADAAASAVENPDLAPAEGRGVDVQDLIAITRAVEVMGAQIAQLSKTVQDLNQRTRGRALHPQLVARLTSTGFRHRLRTIFSPEFLVKVALFLEIHGLKRLCSQSDPFSQKLLGKFYYDLVDSYSG